jgi:hypothetical protein
MGILFSTYNKPNKLNKTYDKPNLATSKIGIDYTSIFNGIIYNPRNTVDTKPEFTDVIHNIIVETPPETIDDIVETPPETVDDIVETPPETVDDIVETPPETVDDVITENMGTPEPKLTTKNRRNKHRKSKL